MWKKGGLLLVGLLAVAMVVLLVSAPRQGPVVQAQLVDGAVGEIEGFVRAEGPAPLAFPADYGPHPDYQTEWWYYTGNLESSDGRHFGYHLTIFRRAVVPPPERQTRASTWGADQIYLGHFALTDVDGQRFQAFERFSRGAAGLAGAQAQPYRVWLDDWQVADVAEAEPGTTRLQAGAGQVAIDLVLTDSKGPVLHGVEGYSQKGPDPGNASYYHSLSRLQTEGIVRVGDREFSVTGLSWKDHEYSTEALAPGQTGWDWFALQLDDGSELKVFHIRSEDGSIDPFSAGSFIDADGSLTPLSREEFQIQVHDTWRSPRTGAEYPSRWTVTVPSQGIILEIEPYLADQELNVSYNYWEGAVHFDGRRQDMPVNGNGYVEMTGYAGSMEGQF